MENIIFVDSGLTHEQCHISKIVNHKLKHMNIPGKKNKWNSN